MEEVQGQEMKVSRWIEGLALLILVQRVTRYVNRHVNGAILIRGGKLDRRRPEADAPAFSYDARDVLPLDGCVLDLLGRLLSLGIYYIVITLLIDF